VPRRPRIALANATVLLTGASGGIGHAIARALAHRGARLLVTGRRRDVLDELATELGATALVADLAIVQDVDRLAAEAVRSGVDVLVANAGMPASGEIGELTGDQVDRMLDVNLRAPIALAHGLAPMMAGRGSGQMVFISSLSGQVASPASSLYSATKFGLRGFALGIREDLRRSGVGVSLVVPGFVSDAGMYAGRRRHALARAGRRRRDPRHRAKPRRDLRRPTQPTRRRGVRIDRPRPGGAGQPSDGV
jgi:short-subunit dehydrogenase